MLRLEFFLLLSSAPGVRHWLWRTSILEVSLSSQCTTWIAYSARPSNEPAAVKQGLNRQLGLPR